MSEFEAEKRIVGNAILGRWERITGAEPGSFENEDLRHLFYAAVHIHSRGEELIPQIVLLEAIETDVPVRAPEYRKLIAECIWVAAAQS